MDLEDLRFNSVITQMSEFPESNDCFLIELLTTET